MATTKAFNSSGPLGGVAAKGAAKQLRDDKKAVQERLVLEHYFSDPSALGQGQVAVDADGRHRPGLTSTVLIDTTANIALVTTAKAGSLAYDTNLNQLKIAVVVAGSTVWTTHVIENPNPLETQIPLAAGDMQTAGPWKVAPTNVAAALDLDDWTDSWGDASMRNPNIATQLVHWDLGNLYSGHLVCFCGCYLSSFGSFPPAKLGAGFRLMSDVSETILLDTRINLGFPYVYAPQLVQTSFLDGWTTAETEQKFVAQKPFYGRYIGVLFSPTIVTGWDSHFLLYRFNAFGTPV